MGYRNIAVYREGILGWVRDGRPTETPVKYPEVPIPLVSSQELVGRDPAGIMLLDIRPRDHFNRGHIAGSINADLEDLHVDMARIPKGSPLVLVDHKGKLTLTTGRFLLQNGFAGVSRLDGGFNAWVKSGLPVEVHGPDKVSEQL